MLLARLLCYMCVCIGYYIVCMLVLQYGRTAVGEYCNIQIKSRLSSYNVCRVSREVGEQRPKNIKNFHQLS